jgi:hypothetical protein
MVLCLQLEGATLVSGAQHGRASHGGEGKRLGEAPGNRRSQKNAGALGGERRHFFVILHAAVSDSHTCLKSLRERLAVAIALPIC